MKVFRSFLHPLCPMWAQSGTFICPFIVLDLNKSLTFVPGLVLGFKVIWFVKCMKTSKLKISFETIEIITI